MHTVIGFFNAAQGIAAVNSALPAVSDQSISISANGRFLLPKRMKAFAGLATGPNLTAARINAPSLRSVLLPQLYPGNVGATIVSPVEIANMGDAGPWIQPNEELSVETSNNAGAAVLSAAVLFLSDKVDPVPPGPQYTLVATAAVTLVAGQWVNTQLTLDQVLPSGEYMVAGMRAVCPNGLAARLVFPGGTNFRPGVVVENAYSGRQIRAPWNDQSIGQFGRFMNTAQPTADVLGLVAGAQTLTLLLDLIKVG